MCNSSMIKGGIIYMRKTTSLGETKRSSLSSTFIKVAAIMSMMTLIVRSVDMCLGNNSEAVIEPTTEQVVEIESDRQSSDIESSADIIVGDSIEPVSEPSLLEEETEVHTEEVEPYVTLSDEEMKAFAALIWLEGGCESIECQEAIASVIINRYTVDRDKYKTLFDVIYAYKQFTPAPMVAHTEPRELQMNIATKITEEGPTIPKYVTYFRSSYFHNWGDQVPYIHIDNTYFSYSASLKDKLSNTEVVK